MASDCSRGSEGTPEDAKIGDCAPMFQIEKPPLLTIDSIIFPRSFR